ncbi:MAG: hypothetical protein D6830_02795 [Ignavibacteria bacterium]|nr:MAG: hypothetical protein D6830_02795 [Ignavibacteria bacterium]
MNFSFLIQARMGSTRYPGKALEKIYMDNTLIDVVYQRVMQANYTDKFNVVVLTTNNRKDDKLVEYLESKQILYFRGDEENVYKRFKDYLESVSLRPDYFFRICSDNPFIEPEFLDDLSNIILHGDDSHDYFSHKDFDGTPSILTHYGLFAELIKTESFLNADKLVDNDYYRQHVTPVLYKSGNFNTEFIEMDSSLRDKTIRLTFDTEEDLSLVKSILSELNGINFNFKEVVSVLEKHPEYTAKMKESIERNAK